MLKVERDTEILIDNQLKNLGWNNDPTSKDRNVYLQRTKNEKDKSKLKGVRPDYVLYQTGTDKPLAIIEAKK
jgi:type I restriction enzyme M protein